MYPRHQGAQYQRQYQDEDEYQMEQAHERAGYGQVPYDQSQQEFEPPN